MRVWYAVTTRTGEIGLRSALGASRGDVLRLVLSDGLRLVGLGILAGVPATRLATRALRSQVHDVPAADPVSAAVALGVLVVCATVAASVPAWRASRVAPAVALNSGR